MKDIQMIMYDFDGVMTDNTVMLDAAGREYIRVHRGDGTAVAAFRKKGIAQVIVTTETNPVVRARAHKLKIPVLHSLQDKKTAVIKYLKQRRVSPQNTIFVGNDINDKDAMRIVGYPVCPADAHQDIKGIACRVLKTKGGDGVIRELLEIVR